MAPVGFKAVRDHLSGINDPRLTTTARTIRLGRFQAEIQKGRVRLQGIITNPHLLKALDPGLTFIAREVSLQRLLNTPTLVLNEIELESVKALMLPVPGEENISQTATAIISRIAPPPSIFSDDAFTVRHAPPKPTAPLPPLDDLKDLQELQVLEARRPEVKQRVGRLVSAIKYLLPYEKWDPSIKRVIEGLERQLTADCALADRAAVLYKKSNAAAPADLTGKDYFELPETLIIARKGEAQPVISDSDEANLAVARARFREIVIAFNELKSTIETHVRDLPRRIAHLGLDPTQEIREIDSYLRALRSLADRLEKDYLTFFKSENKYPPSVCSCLDISIKYGALQDLIFEIGQAYGEAYAKKTELHNQNLAVLKRLERALEQLKAYADLTGQLAIDILEQRAAKIRSDYTEAVDKNKREHQTAAQNVVNAFNVQIELQPKVVPPQPAPPPAPPEPPKILNYYFDAIRHCEEMNRLRSTLSGPVRNIIAEFTADQLAGMKTQEPTREEAMQIADWALTHRNQVGALSKEAADLLEKIQHCMEKYLAENFGLLVIEPSVGTQPARIHDRVEMVGQETGKYSEILRVESLGFTDQAGKVVKKAKVVIGAGTVFTDRAFDITPTSDTVLPTIPAAPTPSIGERIVSGWSRLNHAIVRFQNRVWKGIVWAAIKVNNGVLRTFSPVERRITAGVMNLIRDYITLPETVRMDAFFTKAWSSGSSKRIKRFRNNSLVTRILTETGDAFAELHKFGSVYKLKTVGGHRVEINGHEFAGEIPIKSGTVIKFGDWKHLIDILPARRSFRKGRGVERIAGGESGEIALKNAAIICDRAGRTNNEDAAVHAWINKDLELFAVADGMGGHNAGEVASRSAVQIIPQELIKGVSLQDAIGAASKIIFQESKTYLNCAGMGTTVVAMLIDHKRRKRYIAWVGDSRVKYIGADASQEGQVLTRDHKAIWEGSAIGIEPLVKKLPINDGVMEQVRQLEYDPKWKEVCNVIVGPLGSEQSIKVHVAEMPYGQGPLNNYLLLYSDGLNGGLSESEITGLVRRGGTPIEIARRLVAAALAGGTRDNVSVVVIPAPSIDVSHLQDNVYTFTNK